MTKRPFSDKGRRATELLELVHFDVCGLLSTQARGGYEYFVTFTDDYSRYGFVYLLKHKSETFNVFKVFRALVEKQKLKGRRLLLQVGCWELSVCEGYGIRDAVF